MNIKYISQLLREAYTLGKEDVWKSEFKEWHKGKLENQRHKGKLENQRCAECGTVGSHEIVLSLYGYADPMVFCDHECLLKFAQQHFWERTDRVKGK